MVKNLMRGEKNLPHMPEWKIRNPQENLPCLEYVGDDQMKTNKKRFWHSETFWDYVVPIIVSVIISILTTLAASGLGLV